MCFGKRAIFWAFTLERNDNADLLDTLHHSGINLSQLYQTLDLPKKFKPDNVKDLALWKAALLADALPQAFKMIFSAEGYDFLGNAKRLKQQIADERPQDEKEVQRLIKDLGLL